MTKRLLPIITGAMLLMLASAIAAGQTFSLPTELKGTENLEIRSGIVVAQHDGTLAFNNVVWVAGARIGRILTAPHGPGWLRGTLEWDAELLPVFVVVHPQTAYGAELDPIVLRWNFTRRRRLVPYGEMAGGVAFTSAKIPPGDTSRFNVVPKIGLGWQLFTGPRRSFDISIQAWHLSNAWTAPRNPSMNGLLLSIGYHWFKPKNN